MNGGSSCVRTMTGRLMKERFSQSRTSQLRSSLAEMISLQLQLLSACHQDFCRGCGGIHNLLFMHCSQTAGCFSDFLLFLHCQEDFFFKVSFGITVNN